MLHTVPWNKRMPMSTYYLLVGQALALVALGIGLCFLTSPLLTAIERLPLVFFLSPTVPGNGTLQVKLPPDHGDVLAKLMLQVHETQSWQAWIQRASFLYLCLVVGLAWFMATQAPYCSLWKTRETRPLRFILLTLTVVSLLWAVVCLIQWMTLSLNWDPPPKVDSLAWVSRSDPILTFTHHEWATVQGLLTWAQPIHSMSIRVFLPNIVMTIVFLSISVTTLPFLLPMTTYACRLGSSVVWGHRDMVQSRLTTLGSRSGATILKNV